MREYHASNGISYIAFAGNVEFDDPAFTLRPNVRLCRDQLHIYKVIAQCLNVDLAPTILSATGLIPPETMQGRDFSELYLGPDTSHWRDDFFYEHPTIQSPHAIPASTAVVEKNLKYIYWPDWKVEQLFDLQADPKETQDVIDIPEYADKLDDLRRRHELLRQAAE